MNIQSKLDNWTQYYSVVITRTGGKTETFDNLEGHKVVELVSLCLTVDDPYAIININPMKPDVIH